MRAFFPTRFYGPPGCCGSPYRTMAFRLLDLNLGGEGHFLLTWVPEAETNPPLAVSGQGEAPIPERDTFSRGWACPRCRSRAGPPVPVLLPLLPGVHQRNHRRTTGPKHLSRHGEGLGNVLTGRETILGVGGDRCCRVKEKSYVVSRALRPHSFPTCLMWYSFH